MKTELTLLLEKRLVPVFGAKNPYNMKFGNKLFRPHTGHASIISSNEFTYVYGTTTITNARLKDSDGIISIIFTNESDEEKTLVANTGTINYETGLVSLIDFDPTVSSLGSYIAITAEPRYKNIDGERNQILKIDPLDTNSVTSTAIGWVGPVPQVGSTISTPETTTSSSSPAINYTSTTNVASSSSSTTTTSTTTQGGYGY
jgi:hypothetical protein